ncbi:DUF3277 domain-containing protein [Weizmannia sp. FSL K6-0777]|uniref:phage structural protein n=1 Tax=Heyndrickxia TaxID=2837504 RepID=UPI002E230ECE|nr:DUF3277 domain-containing protein [Weizmannia sp. CD-2023]
MATYDPNLVTVTVAGRFITGFAEGTMVECEKDEDKFSTKVSAKGEVSLVVKNNPLGTITLTLAQDSPSLAYIIQMAKATTPFPVWVSYKNGPISEKAGGTKAVIKKSPKKTFSDDIEERSVEIQVLDYTES